MLTHLIRPRRKKMTSKRGKNKNIFKWENRVPNLKSGKFAL